jgi:hypothetical protein
MKKYIQNLQQKSYAEKSSFAFAASLILTGVIATIWFLTIFANFDTYFETKPSEAQGLANTGSLFDVFKEGLK